jgi:hypothetical protein
MHGSTWVESLLHHPTMVAPATREYEKEYGKVNI